MYFMQSVIWEINYASLVHTLLKGISEEEYEEMAKEQISASGLRIPEAYNPSIIPRYRHIYMWMIYGVLIQMNVNWIL